MDTTKYAKLGLFVTVALLIVIATIFMLGKNKRWFNPQIQLNGIFKNIGGVHTGASVRLAGINIGEVTDIFIVSDSTAQLIITISKKYQANIKKDAALSIGSDGLVGDKVINIIPGDSSTLQVEDKDFLSTYTAINTDAVLENLQDITLNAAAITSDLAVLLENTREGKGTLGALIMDTVVGKNFKQTMVNLNTGSQKLDQNLDAAKNSFLLKPLFKDKKDNNE